MPKRVKKGDVKLIRVQQVGGSYGPEGDVIRAEVVFKLKPYPKLAFGFALQPDDKNLSVNLAMLSLLRDAYVHGYLVTVVYDAPPAGKSNALVSRVDLEKMPEITFVPP